jgi:sorting nexin-13
VEFFHVPSGRLFPDLCIPKNSSFTRTYLSVSVNVDDAVDDMFRQIRGVTDDISGALKTAKTGIKHRLPLRISGYQSDGGAYSEDHPAPRFSVPLTTPYLTDSELYDRLAGASVSEDEYGPFGGNVHGLSSFGWQSDSDVLFSPSDPEALKPGGQPFVSGKDLIQNRFLGSRPEGPFSDGQSPVESYASETVVDDLWMPNEVFCHCCI